MLLAASLALAAPPTAAPRWALGGYATGWAGSYGAAGIGGELRVPIGRRLGVDLFAEHYAVETPRGFRHDHPVGFDLSAPIALPGGARLRPLVGMCAVGSMVRTQVADAPGADDVLFGAHAGAGLEVPVRGAVSASLDVKSVGWMGHDRAVQGWSGSVGTGLRGFAVAQANLGLVIGL